MSETIKNSWVQDYSDLMVKLLRQYYEGLINKRELKDRANRVIEFYTDSGS